MQSVSVGPLLEEGGALLARLIAETDSLSLFIDFNREEVDVMWLRDIVACDAAPQPRPHDLRDAAVDIEYFSDNSRRARLLPTDVPPHPFPQRH